MKYLRTDYELVVFFWKKIPNFQSINTPGPDTLALYPLSFPNHLNGASQKLKVIESREGGCKVQYYAFLSFHNSFHFANFCYDCMMSSFYSAIYLFSVFKLKPHH